MSDSTKESGPKDEVNNAKLSETIMALAGSHHNRANNVTGLCIIILTFFLGVSVQSGELNSIVSQAVIAFIVVDIALFTMAAFYYSLYESDFISGHDSQHASTDLRRADAAMRAALILLQFQPALLTLALRIYLVSLIGFAISCIFAANYAYESRRHKILWPSDGLRYLRNPDK